jgi:pilus assembly protein CpaE
MTTPPPASPADTGPVVLVSDDARAEQWLAQAFTPPGGLKRVPADLERLAERLERERPAVIVIDFQHVEADRATRLAQGATAASPGAVLAAMGRTSDPHAALSALRAGAREFLDVDSPPAEVGALLLGLLRGSPGAQPLRSKVIALIGARAGVGTSTLGVHVGVSVQRALPANRHVALLDLGVPIGDSQIMLETRGSYSFAEAVRNQHRLDLTLVQTALPRHASGLALLALPSSVSELRELTHAAAVAVIQRLRSLFDVQVIDLGGFASAEFVAQVAAASDECLLVCDQAAPSVVSGLEVARSLRARNLRPQLVVNKVDDRVAPLPAQIAERLELPLLATLPRRHVALLQATNTGRLLSDTAPNDPYSVALHGLIARLLPDAAPTAAAPATPGWRRVLRQLTRAKD